MAYLTESVRARRFDFSLALTPFMGLLAAGPLLLVIGRLLPAEGPGLVLRLAAAAACVLLLPGAAIMRALGLSLAAVGLGLAGAFVWSVVAVFGALALTFLFNGSLVLTIVLLALATVGSLLWSFGRLPLSVRPAGRPAALAILAAGAIFGIAVWWGSDVAIQGDALFHLGRVRKLDGFGALHLHALDEFRDGGLHPGYAFPLWHGAMALVARLAGVDPSVVFLHAPAVLTPLAIVLAYAAGAALFRSWPGGVTTAAAQAGLIGFARGGTGSFTLLALPGAAARLLIVPALLAFVFSFVENGNRIALLTAGGAALSLAAVHPTYAFFVAIPLLGFLVVRLALAPAELAEAGRISAALGAVVIPASLFTAWLWPVASRTVSQNPDAAEKARGISHYPGQVDIFGNMFRLAPEMISRGGAIVVGALLALPLAGLAATRRWAAFVLGGSLVLLVLVLIPAIFTSFADAVSLSQARRVTGFLPLPFAIAGAAAMLARTKLLGCVLGLAAGIALQVLYPGEFSYHLVNGGPGWVVWVGLFGAAAAVVAGAIVRPSFAHSTAPWAAAVGLAFVAPTAVDNLRHPKREGPDPDALTPGLVRALRADVKPHEVVFGNVEASYRIAAFLPVYVAAAPPAHVADTPENHPVRRLKDVRAFFRTGDLRIPRRYGARWIVVDRKYSRLQPRLRAVYQDRRFALFRI